jgi:hypothetical protein
MTDIKIEHTDGDEGVDVETCLQQLRDPAVLLAEALYRVHQADAAQAHLDQLGTYLTDAQQAEAERLVARQDHHTRTADSLAYIAKTATDMAAQERQAHAQVFTAEQFDRLDAESGPAREYEPQAVNGVRFTAEISGRWLGYVGGRDWIYVFGYGYVDVSMATGVTVPNTDNAVTAVFAGVVKSATPDDALCVTDGGVAVVLPRGLVTESPDE